MEKAYSFRFYPTPEQESLLRRTLGWCGVKSKRVGFF
ncbi:MAG: helix-turn-helix domain-containing protein, partial [Microcystis sp. M046S2]